MVPRWTGVFGLWLPIAVALASGAFIVYGAVQQDLRLSANDPQIQLSEDIATSLAGGKDPRALVAEDTVDMAASLSPFVIVLDESGKPLASSAQLDGQTPLPPTGVLDYARANKQDRFTWQPRPGVRSAAVVTYYRSDTGSGFVLAGRSLREVERREDGILEVVLLGLCLSLAATLVAAAAASYLPHRS
jgi:hypothetical protein